MTFAAAMLSAALTRAEIIDRFRAQPSTMVEGLVQVVADCPADMRAEFQGPVAGFAADICRKLYASMREKPRRFDSPGIVIHIGDLRTPVTNVVAKQARRDGGRYVKIFVPSPGNADMDCLAAEIARAFSLAVCGKEIDRARAERMLADTDPRSKADREYDEIERWQNGEIADADDEEMLRLCRSVLEPGRARVQDVLRFASRLFLYPEQYDSPFCGKYMQCDFAQAVRLADADLRIRFAAYAKAPLLVAYGGGRGDELYAAARAYSEFLFEIARWKKSKKELLAMLDDADLKLNIAMEKARTGENGGYGGEEKDDNGQFSR